MDSIKRTMNILHSEITIKKNRYGFVNETYSYVAECRGRTYYCTTSENVWGGNTSNTKCAQSAQ